MLLKLLVRGIGWKSFALGGGTVLALGALGRPLLVSTAKMGMGVTSAVSDAWGQAVAETNQIKREAEQLRAAEQHAGATLGAVLSEIGKLRDEVSALKAAPRV